MPPPSRRPPRTALCAAALALGALAASGAQVPGEPRLAVSMLHNGDLRDAPALDGEDALPVRRGPPRARVPPPRTRVPWWRTAGEVTVVERDGRRWLATPPGARAEQPFAAHAPSAGSADGLVVSGRVRGRGRLVLTDGLGGSVELEVGDGTFSIDGAELAARLGRAPVPRFVLALSAASDGPDAPPALWSELDARSLLPCPDEVALSAEIRERLGEVFGAWLEHGLDEQGPRPTGFACHRFDVVTGERLDTGTGGLFDLFPHLLEAVRLGGDPAWSAALEAFLDDYLTLGLHARTGLPVRWDVARDVPLAERFQEVARDLGFLIDLAERGPPRFREPALAAARRMGETVLAHGVLPDGSIAPKYRGSDAAISTAAPPLRRLDVPAQLARLGARTGDARFTDAARNALAELEFTHYWHGTWQQIDPAFDDDYGHYGARAALMWEAHPDDPGFRGLVLSGLEHFAPLWRDALRFGGNVAADQVRCWEIAADVARLEPARADGLGALLALAVRSHVKGEQYGDGAWGDVTIFRFDPRADLQVGDLTGVPANLLWGLGLVYEERLGLRTDEVRALFTAVLRATVEAYRRPHGYLSQRVERAGSNPCQGELRLCPGLLAMLERLEASR